MEVKHIMNSSLIYEDWDASIQVCIETMRKRNIGFLILKNECDEVKGVVTDRDIMLGLSFYSIHDCIRKIAKTNLVYINECDDLRKAADACAYYQVTRLVVLNEQHRLSGIITIFDLLAIRSLKDYVADCIIEIKKSDIFLDYGLECDINLGDSRRI